MEQNTKRAIARALPFLVSNQNVRVIVSVHVCDRQADGVDAA